MPVDTGFDVLPWMPRVGCIAPGGVIYQVLNRVQQGKLWLRCSLPARQNAGADGLLDVWLIERSANWIEWFNSTAKREELDELRTRGARSRPYGSPEWVQRTTLELGLRFTLRPRGTPPLGKDE